MSRGHRNALPPVPVPAAQDLRARARYEALIAGNHAEGQRGTVVFAVYTCNLDEGRGDVYVAAGLGLALVDLGWGVRLVPRDRWHLVGEADVFVAMLPTVDPSVAPAGAWRVAWVRNETERWAAQRSTAAYDQVIASSKHAARRLRRMTDRAGDVLPIGVDTDLFVPPAEHGDRAATAVTTAHFWGTRRHIHRALATLPDDANVEWYGEARDLDAPLARWHRPSVPYFALPAIYARSAIVVDDMNATTLGYGSMNSRFFESAACGSLPLVNGLLGVVELGLGDLVPAYRSPGELSEVLTALRADPVDLERRAAAVQVEVRRHHSWRERAGSFVDLVEQAQMVGAQRQQAPLYFFPNYHLNPYQEMLYDRLDEVDGYPLPVGNLERHLALQNERQDAPGLLHVHWTAPILQSSSGPFQAAQKLQRIKAQLERFRERGGRLMWTVHNVLPHDARFGWAEIELGRLLAQHADLVHVMSEATIDAVRDFYQLDPDRTVVIPHSSYLGRYPDWVSPEAARARLGVLPQEKVLLALGGVRPYKGLDGLLDVFDELVREDPTLRLLVAGRPSLDAGVQDLVDRCRATPRVISRFDHLPDDQLQVWQRAADLAVLPYHQVLNSGAFRLAETFELPVVAPRTGTLAEEGSAAHVRLFTPGDLPSMGSTIRQAIRDLVEDPVRAGKARGSASDAARRAAPDAMSGAFAAAVTGLLRPTER